MMTAAENNVAIADAFIILYFILKSKVSIIYLFLKDIP